MIDIVNNTLMYPRFSSQSNLFKQKSELLPRTLPTMLMNALKIDDVNRVDTQDEDQLKLFLTYLGDATKRPYAARMVFLQFKDRTPIEQQEFELLANNATRPYAARMVELRNKHPLTEREQLELNALEGDKERPYVEQLLALYDLPEEVRTAKDARTIELLEQGLCEIAFDVAALEAQADLDSDELLKLSKMYLKGICGIEHHSVADLVNTNYHSVSYHSVSDCTRGSIEPYLDREITSLLAVESAFHQAAKEIVDANIRQQTIQRCFQKMPLRNIRDFKAFFEEVNMSEQRNHENEFELQKELVVTALLKFVFDRTPQDADAPKPYQFHTDWLNKLKEDLVGEIKGKYLQFDSYHFKTLHEQICTALLNKGQRHLTEAQRVNNTTVQRRP